MNFKNISQIPRLLIKGLGMATGQSVRATGGVSVQ